MNGEIHLTMRDTLKPTSLPVYRSIDISNIFKSGSECWELEQSIPGQRDLLESWIECRGNEQHDTTLSLQYWIVDIQGQKARFGQ